MRQNLNILFSFNMNPNNNTQLVECASPQTISMIYNALLATGNEVFQLNLSSPKAAIKAVKELPPIDFVFNIAEGYLNIPQTIFDGTGSSLIKRLFNGLNLPISHSSNEAMTICRQKELTNNVLKSFNVPTPLGIVIDSATRLKHEPLLKFPLFIKPCGGGNSIGIDEKSIVTSLSELNDRLAYLENLLGSVNILVEEYLAGQEYTVSIVGNKETVILPPIIFANNVVRSTKVKKNDLKSQDSFSYIFPGHEKYLKLAELTFQAFQAVGASDCIRVDIKENSQGDLFVIDVNGTPSLSSTGSLIKSAEASGLRYEDTIALILYHGLIRNNLPPNLQLLEIIEQIPLKPARLHEMIA